MQNKTTTPCRKYADNYTLNIKIRNLARSIVNN